MQVQERLIVPGLGVIILLSSFMLGAPLIYLLLMGLLGLAAVGTYYVPHAVQVETRIGIAALGRVVPIIVGIAGLVVTILAMVYIALAIGSSGAREAGVAISYGIGAYLTALAFIIIAVLHFIPATYKPIGKDNTGD